MKVSVLQQFLHSLTVPLRTASNGSPVAAHLEQACQGLEPFADKDLNEFAEFLRRAQGYERDGHWPVFRPPIAGELIDDPTIAEYAARLKAFIELRAKPGAAISEGTIATLKSLGAKLKAPGMKEVAVHFGVTQPGTKPEAILNQIVERLTGQSLSTKSTSKKTAKSNGAIAEQAASLRQVAGTSGAKTVIEELRSDKTLNIAGLKKLLGELGQKVPSKAKQPELLSAIERYLTAVPISEGSLFPPTQAGADHVSRAVEIIKALKAKADVPRAPVEEIEAELRSLEMQLSRDEAAAVIKSLGLVARGGTKQDAMEAIRRKVYEGKRALEGIAF